MNKRNIFFTISIFYFYLILIACTDSIQANQNKIVVDQKKNYWNQGAEIVNYEVTRYRYGQSRKSKAVGIFVSEPFLPKKQVKSDNPSSYENAVDILKLNLIERFQTGVYDYSIMNSIFTPMFVDYTKTKVNYQPLKISTTIQDWCGHIFIQLNQKKYGYQMNSFSYFEDEGDTVETIKNKMAIPEESFWLWSRLSPKTLPQGQLEVIHSLSRIRLNHLKEKISSAKGSLKKTDKNYQYQILYRNDYCIEITIEKEHPHFILEWREIFINSKTKEKKPILIMKHLDTRRSKYWSKNKTKYNSIKKENNWIWEF